MPLTAQVSLWGLYQIDGTILDGLHIPNGMDAENVKDMLLLETESLEILYPSPTFLKNAIRAWSLERQDVWNRLYRTTVLEYDPISNYDRIEESETDGETSGSTTAINSRTAYNSDSFADTGKDASSGSSTAKSKFKSRTHGNIGVTTSQQMIEAERNVAEFCMTEYIINDFIKKFCVGVY